MCKNLTKMPFPCYNFGVKVNINNTKLGSLCKRGHAYKNTGMSLRYNNSGNACVECSKLSVTQYRIKNPKYASAQATKWKINNLKRFRQQQQKRYKINKERIIQNVVEWKRNKRKTDPNYRLINCLRVRMWRALSGITKSSSTLELLGCSIPDYWQYLESKFLPGMTRQNRGYGKNKWNVDHIVALESFNLSDPEQQRKAFHYTNTQPLWQPDNLSKGKR